MGVELPLFPLDVVLFPHMPLALHLFERRYRVMMRDCQSMGTSFGVVTIAEGQEVGGWARPHMVGTLAQLRDVEPLPDGGFTVLLTGASRFRIDELVYDRPYLRGRIQYLQDLLGDRDEALIVASRVRRAFQEYASALNGLVGEDDEPIDLPDDPELLSYVVAASLQAETRRKQELLEVDSAVGRLRGCLVLLRREAVFLDRDLARRDERIVAVSPN